MFEILQFKYLKCLSANLNTKYFNQNMLIKMIIF